MIRNPKSTQPSHRSSDPVQSNRRQPCWKFCGGYPCVSERNRQDRHRHEQLSQRNRECIRRNSHHRGAMKLVRHRQRHRDESLQPFAHEPQIQPHVCHSRRQRAIEFDRLKMAQPPYIRL